MAFFNQRQLEQDGDFLTRLATLLKQGFSIETAISYLAIANPKLAKRYLTVLNLLQEGYSFQEALQQATFPEFIFAPIYYAAEHGFFTKTLAECGELLKKRAEQEKTLKKTFQYPLILFATVIVVFFLLRVFLLPKFDLLFSQISDHKNLSTTFIFFLLKQLPLILFFLVAAIFLFILFIMRKSKRQNAFDRAKAFVRIPIFSSFIRIHYSQLFARECGYLLKSGLSVQKMLILFSSPSSPAFFQEIGKRLAKNIEKGLPFAASVSQLKLFETELVSIIQHGEQNATIADEMLFYYELCYQKSMAKTEKLFGYIQPLAFLVIGILIISIYLSILFPMFSMVDQI
ncbi:competence type IV pilus assembly protein ComGB [Listeria kieliensis]